MNQCDNVVDEMDEDFTNRVASLCLEKFNSLPNKGKPISGKEWTLLSGIVQSDGDAALKVVAVATGTKCIGKSGLCPKGTVVNDSHAEVLARRALMRYLLKEIAEARGDRPSIFHRDPSAAAATDRALLALRPGVAFHMFCTGTPCGDASIFPLDSHADYAGRTFGKRAAVSGANRGGPETKRSKPKAKRPEPGSGDGPETKPSESGSDGAPETARPETAIGPEPKPVADDVHRTGAKCLDRETKRDPLLPGSRYHVVGAVRTKPGRGDPTLSVSCSDKLFRWNFVGVQGAILSLAVEPVFLSSVTVGGQCPYSAGALRRAVARGSSEAARPCPALWRSALRFEHAKPGDADPALRPCPSSVVWWDGGVQDNGRCHEVLVDGRKQGATRKTADKPSGRSGLCKKSLLDEFKRLEGGGRLAAATYAQVKSAAVAYGRQWERGRSVLGCWTEKPDGLCEFV